MTEYEYETEHFYPARGETVSVPDAAIGVTTTTFGDPAEEAGFVTVRYLAPVEDGDE